jgi:response regulator RpfG family c-di-GMP phosphodiesterase/tRNA A-37 threonylcarbamoyl transferase component Bud32
MNSPARLTTNAETRGVGLGLPGTTFDAVRASLGSLWAGQSRQLPSGVANLLNHLIKLGLVAQPAVTDFLKFHAERLQEFSAPEKLGRALIAAGLLSKYQLERVLAGDTHGLVLGNYRVLDRLGGGSVGVVYLGEHVLLKRRVAIKVLPTDDGFPQSVLDRFYGEMRVLAQLDHPHIVAAYDAGAVAPQDRGVQTLHYLVMEILEGDLENYVYDHGTLPVPQACEWMRQAASGLQQAHDHHLIHRDLKPSNLLRNEQNQVKVVDFGLAREFHSNRTEPRCLLGSVEFMAPEQSVDPTSVRAAADIYGLGATLFWLLTGHTPYQREHNVADALRRLQSESPRRLRDFMADAPQELDALVAQMLERDPDRRPESARAVMQALARFSSPAAPNWEIDPLDGVFAGTQVAGAAEALSHVLIVDDEATVRQVVRAVVEPMGCICFEAEDGEAALEILNEKPIDVVVLDLHLPHVHGYDICVALRQHPTRPHVKIIIMTGHCGPDERATALEYGADDFIAKPLSLPQLAAQVHHHLRLKSAQDRLDQLTRHLLTVNKQLEHSLDTRQEDVRRAEDALLFGMAKMAEVREGEAAGHFRRLQKYCACLAEKLRFDPAWSGAIDSKFLENLNRCVPLHDIGKIGLPDSVVQYTGRYNEKQRHVMETHVTVGADLLDAIGREYGKSLEFLSVARAIVRHHHERWDGRGYPDQLAGEDIPAAARVFAVADVYDSLRCKRPHRAALGHPQAVRVILQDSPGQFDPTVQRAFASCQDEFQRIFESVGA